MNETLQLGSLLIPYPWLIIATGLFIGYFLLTYVSSFKEDRWKSLRETVVNGVIWFIFSFLFGSILFHIETFLSDPLAVLSYPSGGQELYLSILVVIGYFVYASVQKNIPIHLYLHALLTPLFSSSFLYAFFEQTQGESVKGWVAEISPWANHPVSLYMMFFSACFLVWILSLQVVEKSSKHVLTIYFLWVFSQLMVSSFMTHPLFFGVPITNVFFYFLLFIGTFIALLNQFERKQRLFKWKT
ncbi:hypothetical protein [Texcoconibacillus texcoconensis]|uniref:Uncharacterized protein n=1 Tax=Texcoconibacillus texcoconensis TaxID=1095777 RepID=A0A840QRQ9_9BACI|nr:hypothetical protein [Texcoconibacillus texcoconensis]MBB5174045.1 hypothetical protein [Texcoconibacillus texcoconensis]